VYLGSTARIRPPAIDRVLYWMLESLSTPALFCCNLIGCFFEALREYCCYLTVGLKFLVKLFLEALKVGDTSE